jgi:hypothetical protein
MQVAGYGGTRHQDVTILCSRGVQPPHLLGSMALQALHRLRARKMLGPMGVPIVELASSSVSLGSFTSLSKGINRVRAPFLDVTIRRPPALSEVKVPGAFDGNGGEAYPARGRLLARPGAGKLGHWQPDCTILKRKAR